MALLSALVAGVTPPAGAITCAGDCNYAGSVGIAELITGVNIALGGAASAACRAMDPGGDGRVSIDELVAAVSNALGGCPVPVAAFQVLEDLAGGSESAAHAISADGTTVVGEVEPPGQPERAFRWRSESGLELLNLIAGHDFSSAWGVSADGSTIVGRSQDAEAPGDGAFRWMPATGSVLLPLLREGDGETSAFDVSADGSLAVGWSGFFPARAVIWNESGVPRALLGDELPSESTQAYAITPDGRVVAGTRRTGSTSSEPFRWAEATGLVGLGDIRGGQANSAAAAISEDGRVICGEATFENYGATFCWRQDTGMVRLPNLPEMYSDSDDGMGMSADGSIVVGGNRFFDLREPRMVAVRWDAAGVHAIADQLRDVGVDLGTWHLEYASDVTPDGQTIVGGAVSPDGKRAAWIAVLPTRTGR
jgi:uncharacterized membrane protein